MTKARVFRTLFAITLMSTGAACTVHQAETPSLTGPSEFALSVTVAASPDSINQDGGSQSSIRVTAKGIDGKGVAGVSIRVDMQVVDTQGVRVAQDFGVLSARNIVTGSDGTAFVVYTAPPPTPGGITGTCASLPGTCVTIVATPLGTDFSGAVTRSVEIRLVPVGVILPPADTPTAQFSFTPTAPAANSPVAFDASASCGGSADTSGRCLPSNNTVVSYSWTFGDGSSGSGKTATHAYASPGPYSVTLTVTNDRGIAASTIKQVSVGTGTPPTAAFVSSPANPAVLQDVSFNASISTAAPGHSIVSYSWDFGDGAKKTGITTTHDFASPGTFNVVLTVTDEAGQTGTAIRAITVGATAPPPVAPPPTAAFVFSPAAPQVGQSVSFNATASTAATGHSIVSYSWNFGDGGVASGVVATHTFATAGTYNVVLAVTDDTGQTGTATSGVTVGSGGGTTPPTAAFVFSPTSPQVGQSVSFNATASTAASGHSIVSYTWDFGDGSVASGVTTTHSFAASGTYNVVLVVVDDTGQRATATQGVTVTAGTGGLTADFNFSPTNPVSGALVTFNANTSSPLASITSFDWDFGDGTVVNGQTSFLIDHSYFTSVGAIYTVRLTVHDSGGRTATTTKTITVAAGAGPIAAFTISPSPASVGATVTFDGSPSTAAVRYEWSFGDGSAIVSTTPPVTAVTHAYSSTGTYTIRLTVFDSVGRSNSTTHTLLVQ